MGVRVNLYSKNSHIDNSTIGYILKFDVELSTFLKFMFQVKKSLKRGGGGQAGSDVRYLGGAFNSAGLGRLGGWGPKNRRFLRTYLMDGALYVFVYNDELMPINFNCEYNQ